MWYLVGGVAVVSWAALIIVSIKNSRSAWTGALPQPAALIRS